MQQSAQPPATPVATIQTGEGKTISLSVPQTEAEVTALEMRRTSIRDQILQASDRRNALVQQIRSAPEGVAKTGLEQRIALLDQNLLQMERELATVSDRLSAAPAAVSHYNTNSLSRSYNNGFDDGVGAGIGGSVAVLAVLLLFRWWRNRKKPKVNPQRGEDSSRIENVERGIEAIAIEVERISEGQRFVTKLLSEMKQPVAAIETRSVEPSRNT